MLILTATAQEQGARPNDFNWNEEGELVEVGFACDRDRRDPDGGCGCGRSFVSLATGKAGTTAKVVDSPMTRAEYAALVIDTYKRGGWGDAATEIAKESVKYTLSVARDFKAGDVIERRLDDFAVRTPAA